MIKRTDFVAGAVVEQAVSRLLRNPLLSRRALPHEAHGSCLMPLPITNGTSRLSLESNATIGRAPGVKASKFMSETELEANKAKHGERLEDGTFAGRTLREALAANKAEKEQQFQDGWKQMKQGAAPLHSSHGGGNGHVSAAEHAAPCRQK